MPQNTCKLAQQLGTTDLGYICVTLSAVLNFYHRIFYGKTWDSVPTGWIPQVKLPNYMIFVIHIWISVLIIYISHPRYKEI